ncbi:hypothetical protein VPHD518_0106 [Vibrio phage D518]
MALNNKYLTDYQKFRGFTPPPKEHIPFVEAMVEHNNYTYSGDDYGWVLNSPQGIRMVSARKRVMKLQVTWVIKCYAQSVSTMALLHGLQVQDMVSTLKEQTNEYRDPTI